MFKKFSILILSVLIFFEGLLPRGMGFSEASKIGELYSHYLSHKNQGISFEKFIWMHYSSESKHKSNTEHKKLPSFESQISFCFDYSLSTVFTNSNTNGVNFKDASVLREQNDLYQFQYLKFLLNPPQIG